VSLPRGGADYGGLLEELRRLTDAVAAAHAPDEVVVQVTDILRQAREALEPHRVDERAAPSGNRPDLPGRGHPILPPYVLDRADAQEVSGRVTFSRAYLGGGAAAHGGVQPLLFDELLGRLVSTGRPTSRTAFLHVDYRRITSLDTELAFRCWVDRVDGRKLYARGELRHDGELLAEAEGLFLVLLPGQP
jgi:hypothetical protein